MFSLQKYIVRTDVLSDGSKKNYYSDGTVEVVYSKEMIAMDQYGRPYHVQRNVRFVDNARVHSQPIPIPVVVNSNPRPVYPVYNQIVHNGRKCGHCNLCSCHDGANICRNCGRCSRCCPCQQSSAQVMNQMFGLRNGGYYF